MGLVRAVAREQIILLVTVAVAVIFGLTLKGFATVGNLLSLMRNVAILGTLGLGMGVVVIGRGIDLSQSRFSPQARRSRSS